MIITVIIIQWFSLTAPQQPKNDTINTITPTIIINIGAAKNQLSIKLL